MRTLRISFFILFGFTLEACSTLQSIIPAPKDPVQTVFDLRVGFDTAMGAAVSYAKLPDCGSSPAPCSNHAAVVQIDKAKTAALAALDAAEDTVRNHPTMDATAVLATAENGVTALQTILTTYGVQ